MPDDIPRAASRAGNVPPQRVTGLLKRLGGLRSADEARELLPLLPRLIEQYGGDHRVQRQLSEIALRAGALEPALGMARQALALQPGNLGHRLHLAVCLLASGRHDEAAAQLRESQPQAWTSAREVSLVASLMVRASCHEDAARCYERAVELEPRNARAHFSLAATYRFLGRLEDAEASCDRAIALDPREFEAYLVRADLRRQTPERNHVQEMESLLAGLDAPYMGEAMLRHALAKEYEDLGEYDRSFTHLERGAALRRRHLSYSVDRDLELIEELMLQFPGEGSASAGPGDASERAVFVLGLPRTGTTLVERILSSHSQVESAGELPDFPRLVAKLADAAVSGCAKDPLAMVRAARELDVRALGAGYLDALAKQSHGARRVVDKLPFNYLNVGLIQRALPAATVIHVTRDPMDTCYAIFKTLFQRAYPFSYDLDDLGRYFIAYWRLMAHWEASFPGYICRVRYEDLVADPEREGRRLIETCGLSWEQEMASFHTNPAPSMTASASQVRQPVYRSSVGKWRHYRDQLRPLIDRLRDAGIEVNA